MQPSEPPAQQTKLGSFLSSPERQAENIQRLIMMSEAVGKITEVTEFFDTIVFLLNYDTLLKCLLAIAEEGTISGRELCKKIGYKSSQIGTIQRRLAEWQGFNLIAKEPGRMGKYYIPNEKLRMGLKRLASGIAYLHPSQ